MRDQAIVRESPMLTLVPVTPAGTRLPFLFGLLGVVAGIACFLT